MKYIILSLIIILSWFLTKSGNTQITRPPLITGRIINCKNHYGVGYAQIYNESRRQGYITDSLGYFSSSVQIGDTIAILSLGYLSKVVVITDSLINSRLVIRICPRSYPIEEVEVEMPRTYKQLKKAILAYQPEEFKVEGVPEGKPIDVPLLLDTTYLKSGGFAIFHPVSFLYYNLSKKEKTKRKAFYLQKQEEQRPAIEKKYNREIVKEFTGLEGDELTNFIGYCNFSHQFLYESTALEIIQAIDEKYKLYIELKNDENADTKPLNDIKDDH